MVFSDKQTAVANQPGHLTGRRWAPTGGPTPVGGEGTPSREVACPAGSAAMFGVCV